MQIEEPIALELVGDEGYMRRVGGSEGAEQKQREEEVLIGICRMAFMGCGVGGDGGREVRICCGEGLGMIRGEILNDEDKM